MNEMKVRLVVDLLDRISSPVKKFSTTYVDSLKRMTTATKSLHDRINSSVKSFNDFGQGFALKISAPIAAFDGLAVKTFSNMEKLNASLKTVTGSQEAATAAMAEITKFATTTPYDLEQVTNSFIKLKALGLDPSMDTLRSYGNTASAMGKDLNQFIEAVADASTLEFERLKEFGIKANQQGKYVTFTFQGVRTKVKKDADDIQKYLKSIGDVQFAGAMEEQMDTLNGGFSNLADTISQSLNVAGTQIVKTTNLKSLVSQLTQAISDLTSWFQNLSPGMRNFIVYVSLSLAVLGPLLIGIGQMVIGIGGMIYAFGLLAPVFAATIAFMKVFGLALVTTPFGWWVLGIAALTAGAILLVRNWSKVSEFFESLWTGIKNTFAQGVDYITKALAIVSAPIQSLMNGISRIGGAVGNSVTGMFKSDGQNSSSLRLAPADPIKGLSGQKVDTGGTLHIKIDSEGAARVVDSTPNDSRMDYTVDSGLLMGAN